jgi:hypothetical protein
MKRAKITTFDLLSYLKAHVNRKGEPLCRQARGDGFRLCSKQEFVNLPPDQKCLRCEQKLGGRGSLAVFLGPQQRRCLRQMKRMAGGHGWCAVADLCSRKTDAGWTSLYRTLRALVKLGLIEKRTDARHRAYVKLRNPLYEAPDRIVFAR